MKPNKITSETFIIGPQALFKLMFVVATVFGTQEDMFPTEGSEILSEVLAALIERGGVGLKIVTADGMLLDFKPPASLRGRDLAFEVDVWLARHAGVLHVEFAPEQPSLWPDADCEEVTI